MQDQRLHLNWGKIGKSRYCDVYKGWKKEIDCEKYVLDRQTDSKTIEQWARIRCRNLGRERNKGFRNKKGRLCREEKENLEHILVCQKAREGMEEK